MDNNSKNRAGKNRNALPKPKASPMEGVFRAYFKGIESISSENTKFLLEPIDILKHNDKSYFKVVVSNLTSTGSDWYQAIEEVLSLSNSKPETEIVVLPLPEDKKIVLECALSDKVPLLFYNGQIIKATVSNKKLTKIEVE